jgi:hypothetical protein
MKINARGGVTSWEVYDIVQDADSDYEIDADLLARWEEVKRSFINIQEELESALTEVTNKE